jgi:dTMP kinase
MPSPSSPQAPPPSRAGGRLIVLDGPDGVGKTTQAARLVEQLRSARPGRAVLPLREPGGTPLGDALRQLLLDPGHAIAPTTETLLFLASRAQLVADVIRPELDRGTLIVLDRFFLSTYAYQVGGHGLPEGAIRAANALAVAGVVPDRTLLFDYPAGGGEALARAEARQGADAAGDRMHRLGPEFHARVAHAFLAYGRPDWQRTHPECGPIVTIDARGSREAVAARVWAAVEPLV